MFFPVGVDPIWKGSKTLRQNAVRQKRPHAPSLSLTKLGLKVSMEDYHFMEQISK